MLYKITDYRWAHLRKEEKIAFIIKFAHDEVIEYMLMRHLQDVVQSILKSQSDFWTVGCAPWKEKLKSLLTCITIFTPMFAWKHFRFFEMPSLNIFP